MPILKIRVTSFDKIKENVFEGFRNNQSRKALKGWIKKPKDDEHTSTKGMDPKFLRDQMRERLRKKN